MSRWVKDVEELALIAKDEPQLAYSAYTKGLSHRWTYVQRTISDISQLFKPLEAAISQKFIPAMLGREISETYRDIIALPLRLGGLGIANPVTTSEAEYRASTAISSQLFLLYINDLPEAIKSKVFLFADDLKMIANPFDKEVVDDDLRSLEIWENTWLLKFNTAKCKVLHFDINSNPCNDYVLDGSKLEVVDVERDLVLLISKDLRWDEQVKGSLCKANQTIACSP